MTIAPFLTLPLRSKKDIIRARQRARRIASILQFDSHEQICIAAGTFVIALQAVERFRKVNLCFQIENHCLCIFAENSGEPREQSLLTSRLTKFHAEGETTPLFRMAKPLPPQETPAEELDLVWLVSSIEHTASEGLFDEFARQNQEVLSLLLELGLYQGGVKEKRENPANPHAA